MGKTKDSGSEPDPQPSNASMDWKEIEYRECSEDWRHRDRLIWATLPIAATVAGVIVGVAYGQIPDDKLGIRFFILVIGVFLTLVMLISLIRHHRYQEGSEEQIRSLQLQLGIRDWDRNPRKHPPCRSRLWDIAPSKKVDAALPSRTGLKSGFMWMVIGTVVVMVILLVLMSLTLAQLICPIDSQLGAKCGTVVQLIPRG